MAASNANKYLEAQVKTASKEQLLLLLFDGAIRFAGRAKEALGRGDFDTSYTALAKAQKIVLELICAMDKKMGEPLYGNLCGLYKFAYFRLLHANLRRDPALAEEAITVLQSLRETWSLSIEMRQKQANGAPVLATGTSTARVGINVEG